jgi:hypothetical protein
MGSTTAAQIGLKNHDKFDIIAPLGGAADLGYMLHILKDIVLSGFCVPPEVGKMCPTSDDGYHYEKINCGGPMAGGFNRKTTMEALKDMTIAFGNLGSFNVDHPYLPRGVEEEYITERTDSERCNDPVRLTGYYDWRYNPEGKYPVITYCEAKGIEEGVFNPDATPNYPVEILLAVDINDNGVRDSGEPVLFAEGERYEDYGEDGLPSDQEPGYHPETNPDPANDDYDHVNNAFGTEGNHHWDNGEPYLDYGLDGVEGTASSVYDFGEGNGHYDFNLNVMRVASTGDPSSMVKNLSFEQLARLDFYMDAGVRDHLYFRWVTEAFAGVLQASGRPVDFRHQFSSILEEGYDGAFDVKRIDWSNTGRDVMVIYGTPEESDNHFFTGDGGHVGNGAQVLWRFWAASSYVSNRWPNGNYDAVQSNHQMIDTTYYSHILGHDMQYIIFLPPGYDENKELSYPVLYFVHGIGMRPVDLTYSALFVGPWMKEGMMQKFIMVFPNGRCNHQECFTGTFFANQKGRDKAPKRFEDSFVQELMPHIDKNYRTKAPEEVVVDPEDLTPLVF